MNKMKLLRILIFFKSNANKSVSNLSLESKNKDLISILEKLGE